MARAAHLGAWFLTGCVASSLLGWMATLPVLSSSVVTLYILLFIAWAVAWMLDDAVIPFLRVDLLTYRAGLLGFLIAFIIGGVALWLTDHLPTG